jgi:hypothetical protein
MTRVIAYHHVGVGRYGESSTWLGGFSLRIIAASPVESHAFLRSLRFSNNNHVKRDVIQAKDKPKVLRA